MDLWSYVSLNSVAIIFISILKDILFFLLDWVTAEVAESTWIWVLLDWVNVETIYRQTESALKWFLLNLRQRGDDFSSDWVNAEMISPQAESI